MLTSRPPTPVLTSLRPRFSFTGPLPATIPANSELRSFHVANAGANGTIPETLGLPTNLQTIELSQNLLSGAIPAGIVGPRLDALLLNNNL